MIQSLFRFTKIGKGLFAGAAILSGLNVSAQQVTRFHLGVIVLPRYSTIDSAIKAASAGDSLVLSPHRFNEFDVTISKDIKLTGTKDASGFQSVVDASGKGRGFIIYSGKVEFQSLTITNGKVSNGAGGAVYNLSDSDVLFTGSAKLNNNAVYGTYANGGAVFSAGRVIVGDSALLSNNYAQETGGAIYGFSKVILRGNARVANNRTDGSGGGIFSPANAGLVFTDASMVDNNTAVEAGGGAYGTGTIQKYAVVKNNKAEYGAGLASFDDALFLQDSSTISGNIAGTYGAGIWLNNCNLFGYGNFHIINNSIPAVTGTLNFGGAIYNVNGDISIYGGTITGNQSPIAAIYNSAGSQPVSVDISACHIYNPKADGKRMPEVFNSPALDPTKLSFTSDYCWWGSNDTNKLIADRPGTFCGRMNTYAKLSWHLNNDVPITPLANKFRVSADLKGSDGAYLDSTVYRSISGKFSATKGSFSNTSPIIDTNNKVWSLFNGPLKNDTTIITGIVDADTFRSAKIYLIGLDINEQFTAKEVRVFPNPASTLIQLDQVELGSNISVTDLGGRILLSQNVTNTGIQTVQLESLPSGMYILLIREQNGAQASARFVKQ
jgi:predicted outer membrane repeat protein